MYSDEHYKMLERIEQGFVWIPFENENVDAMLQYFFDEGLIRSREDVTKGFMALTELGKSVLEQKRKERAKAEHESRKEQAREATRLEERHQDRADAERRYRGQNRTAIYASVISALGGFILGLIAEHFGDIVGFAAKLFHFASAP